MAVGVPPEPRSEDLRWRPVAATMHRHAYHPGSLIETLHAVQNSYGYIDERAMRTVAAALNLPLSQIYGVATFYHLFRLKPKGRHTCMVCLGTACYIKGADQLIQAISSNLQVQPGATTTDGNLSLFTARCLGSCSQAPAVVIDDRIIGNAEADAINDYLRKLDKGPPAEEACNPLAAKAKT